jgi:hypothetical protein
MQTNYIHIGFKNFPNIVLKNWKDRWYNLTPESIFNKQYNCYDIWYNDYYFNLTSILNTNSLNEDIKFIKWWYLLNIRNEKYYIKDLCQECICNNNDLIVI